MRPCPLDNNRQNYRLTNLIRSPIAVPRKPTRSQKSRSSLPDCITVETMEVSQVPAALTMAVTIAIILSTGVVVAATIILSPPKPKE